MTATATRDRGAGRSSASLGRRARRRALARSVLRAILTSTALVFLYYQLPLDDRSGRTLAVNMFVGFTVFVALLALNVWKVTTSEFPRLRAMDAMAALVPLFLVLFAATYVRLAEVRLTAFSEPLDRTDALYYTVTVFSTVGFGDITPIATSARVVTMVQMVGDLILFGLFAKVITGAMTEGLRRRDARRSEDGAASTSDDDTRGR